MDTMHTRQKPTLINYQTTLFTVLWLVVFVCISVQSIGQIPEGILTVRPVEIDDVLINPGIGFSTFQMFNGDNHQANQDVLRSADLERYQKSRNEQENIDHPATSLAYFRILWSVIEPRQEVYQWEYIDGLLKLARLHGQTLMLRISPYKGKPIDDVPSWYREMVGDERSFPHVKWPVDPENPLYAEYFGNMIRELGKRYDGHPDLESVDISFVGWAGEGAGTDLLSTETMQNLIDPYIESFRKTPLIVLLSGEKANHYIVSKATVGWRQDCLGDLGFWADEQNGWTHMYDYYPQTILQYDMQDTWKRA
ncbi:MAG: beta-galactosidase, partial [Bacteroidales bacterium]|nr:beta-galactosidase [Bacteroidales bacterium]